MLRHGRRSLQPVPAAAIAAALIVLGACRSDGGRSVNVPDIPVYPGAVLREAVKGDELDPTEYYVVERARAEDVMAWYAESMPRHGWAAAPGGDPTFVIYHTERGCYGFVGVVPRDDGALDLQISQQRAGTPCLAYFTPDPADAGFEQPGPSPPER